MHMILSLERCHAHVGLPPPVRTVIGVDDVMDSRVATRASVSARSHLQQPRRRRLRRDTYWLGSCLLFDENGLCGCSVLCIWRSS